MIALMNAPAAAPTATSEKTGRPPVRVSALAGGSQTSDTGNVFMYPQPSLSLTRCLTES